MTLVQFRYRDLETIQSGIDLRRGVSHHRPCASPTPCAQTVFCILSGVASFLLLIFEALMYAIEEIFAVNVALHAAEPAATPLRL